jgi:hypothetical protein
MALITIVLLAGSYLALHDIFRDYASPKVLQEQTELKFVSLPEWTECRFEWCFIAIGFWFVLLFQIIFLSQILWYAKKYKEVTLYPISPPPAG